MSDKNPTQKGAVAAAPVVVPRCPSCDSDLRTLNICTMTIPVPADPRGDWTFMVPCCPNPECGKVVPVHFFGFAQREHGVATPPSSLWRPS